MASLSSLTTFPGQVDSATSTAQFCRVEVVMVDLDGEDSDIAVEDIHAASGYDRYQPPLEEDEEEEAGTSCVALAFYTAGGEEIRYIQDSETDDASEVLAQVLSVLGEKGWQAINVIVDEEYEETWYLQRIMRR
jgi:hypothetical protein